MKDWFLLEHAALCKANCSTTATPAINPIATTPGCIVIWKLRILENHHFHSFFLSLFLSLTIFEQFKGIYLYKWEQFTSWSFSTLSAKFSHSPVFPLFKKLPPLIDRLTQKNSYFTKCGTNNISKQHYALFNYNTKQNIPYKNLQLKPNIETIPERIHLKFSIKLKKNLGDPLILIDSFYWIFAPPPHSTFYTPLLKDAKGT